MPYNSGRRLLFQQLQTPQGYLLVLAGLGQQRLQCHAFCFEVFVCGVDSTTDCEDKYDVLFLTHKDFSFMTC
jgi:hypothetical protein